MTSQPPPRLTWRGVLEKLALHRPDLRAWAMYDWANSAMMTTVVTAVFPIYFQTVAADEIAEADPAAASGRFALVSVISMIIVALIAPVLGAIADYAALKKRLLGVFLAMGVLATSAMFLIERGDWQLASVLYVLAYVGAASSFVFYDSLLPHIARGEEMDRLSTSAYALGYLGGGLLLGAQLAWIMKPDWFGLPSGENLTASQKTLPVRLSFVSVAIWWLAFSIPLFRRVAEPPRARLASAQTRANLVTMAFRQLGQTLTELRVFKQAFLLLIAFLIYNDGITTIYKMATTYGAEIGIPDRHLITAILLVQFVGIPFAVLFARLAETIGTKRSILCGLGVYALITLFGYFMRTPAHFFILAVVVAMVQGGCQALSRSLFASMIPKEKSAEFFALFAVCEKFAGVLGPFFFFVMVQATGSSRNAVLAVLSFFVIGAVLLQTVKVEEGQQTARAADALSQAVPAP